MPKHWTWNEVLDAAFALEHSDFLAVLSEMLLVRHMQDPRAKQRLTPMFLDHDVPYDEPLEDIPFADVPAAIPLDSRRRRSRKR